MQTITTENARAANKRASAADRSGAIQTDVIRRSVDELVAQYKHKQDAAEAYKDSIEAIAAKGGVSKKALNAYIAARAKQKMPEAHAVATQLSLLFEEI